MSHYYWHVGARWVFQRPPNDFERKTSISVIKNGRMVFLIAPPSRLEYFIDVEGISRIKLEIGIGIYCTNAEISWTALDGKIIEPKDLSIDYAEISMWFSELEVEKIKAEYSRINRQIFRVSKTFNYELIVSHFSFDSTYLDIEFSKDISGDLIENILDEYIRLWNFKSEKNEKAEGVIHYSECRGLQNDSLLYYIDFGSAGEDALLGILDSLDDLRAVIRVRIT